MRSSSAPGPSPMIITGAAGLPSANTVLVAVRFKPQPSNPAITAASASTVSALAASPRDDWADSAGDSVKAVGGGGGVAEAAEMRGVCAKIGVEILKPG